MELGTVSFEDRIYNLDEIKVYEVKELLEKIDSKKESNIKRIGELIFGDGTGIYQELTELNSEVEVNIKNSAIVQRAYVNRVTSEKINDKINKEMNAIKASVLEVYPKFKEGTRNFSKIKDAVSLSLINYEKNLEEVGRYYDHQIELLILEKVELESSLFFAIFAKKYFGDKLSITESIKENESITSSIKETIVSFIDRIAKKKEEKIIVDPMMMNKVMDSQNVVNELKDIDETAYNDWQELNNQNDDDMKQFSERIEEINRNINTINSEKISRITEAMEKGTKEISKEIKRPKRFGKITRFLVIRFNLTKYVQETIVQKLDARVNDYRDNELPKIIKR